MPRLSDEDLNKVERALAEAHRSRQEPVLGADWAHDVMRDIRQETAGRGLAMPTTGIARIVWQGAAAAAVLALILCATALIDNSREPVELTALLSDELEAGTPLIE